MLALFKSKVYDRNIKITLEEADYEEKEKST